MARTRASSLSMASEEMRNSGMIWRTTPPRAPVASNRVTGTPSLPRKKAAAIPAGPPPTTATFLPETADLAFCLDRSAS